MGRGQGKGGKGYDTLVIAINHFHKGIWGKGSTKTLSCLALPWQGENWKLNVMFRVARGRLEIRGNIGGIAVHAHRVRYYVMHITYVGTLLRVRVTILLRQKVSVKYLSTLSHIPSHYPLHPRGSVGGDCAPKCAQGVRL